MRCKIAILFLFAFTIAQAAPSGYSYYKLLTIQESQISVGSTNLNDFPILVRITDNDLRHTSSGGYVENLSGFDIIFTSADGNTIISHQLEKYNPVTGELVAWVKIPTVSATVNTNFYLYFGNSSTTLDPSTTSTWDANFSAVWHLHADENDATANSLNLTNSGSTNQTNALAADGQDLERTDYMQHVSVSNLQITGNITLETWINFESFENGTYENPLISYGGNTETAANNYLYWISLIRGGGNNNRLLMYWEYGAGTDAQFISTVASSPVLGAWHHVAVVRDVSTNRVKFYFDGVQLGADVTFTNAPAGGTTSLFRIGEDQATNTYDTDGDFDEVRISDIVRIPEWIEATYASNRTGANFIVFGSTNCVTFDMANAGPDQTICASSVTLAGNSLTSGSGTWTLVSGTGTIANPNLPNTMVTLLGVGANVFQWAVTNGPCPSYSDQVTIYVDPNPTTANAGVDQTTCSSTSNFAGNSPTIGTGTWTLVSGTGVPSSPTSPTSVVTGLSVGTNIFQWTITNGTCPASTDFVTITVDQPPTTANAGVDQTICASSSSFTGNTPTTGTGTWSLVSGTGIPSSPNSPSSVVTGLSMGANIFRWRISNGTCPPSDDFITINVDANPTTANAGSDQTICASSSTFAGNTPVIGSGTWILVSGTGVPSSPTSPTSVVTGLSVGTNIFQWTITNGTCPASTDLVTITVDPPPTTANAGIDQTICASSSSFTGNTPTTGTGTWSLVSGTGTITNVNLPTSAVTGLSVGANVFRWRISNGTCSPSDDFVTINVDANPTTANAGADQTICASFSSFAGNTPTIGTGMWTLVSGTGSPISPSSPASAVTGLSIGANTFLWTISNGTCPASSDFVTIFVYQVPTVANAGPDQTICTSSSTLAGNTPTIGTGTWSLVSGTGTATSPNSPTSAVTGLSVGANIFRWRISNGTCSPSDDYITINVDPMPTVANAGTDQTICSSSSAFAGNTPTTGTGFWTLISGTGVPSSPTLPTSGVTALSVGANIFQWTITSGTCPSSSDQVTINVDPLPTTANAGVDQTICASSSILSGNTPSIGNGLWTLVSGTGVPTNPTSPTSAVTGLSVGANVFRWRITNGTCAPSDDFITINVDPMPTVANAGADQYICSSSSAFIGNSPIIGNGFWYLVSGTGTPTTPSSPTSAVTGLSVGTNIFRWVITSGTCPTSADTVRIFVDPVPTVANANADQNLCITNPNTSLNANTPTIGSGLWTLVSGTATITNPTSPNTTVTAIGLGTSIFQWTITSGTCPPSTDQMTIIVYQVPTIANAGNDTTICSSSHNFNGNTPVNGTGIWSLVSGTGTPTSPNSPTSAVTGLSVGANIFQWTIANGPCAVSRDTMVINVDPMPTTSNAGPDQVICDSTAFLQGNMPLIGSGFWTRVGGTGNVVSPTQYNSTVTGLFVISNLFEWAISNGTCPTSRDTLVIAVNQYSTQANAGLDQVLCNDSATLIGNFPVIGSATWTLVAGTGNIISPTADTSLVTGLSVGQNIFEWSIVNSPCPVSRDTIIIQVDDFPTGANAGSDQTVCSTTSVFSGNTPIIGNGMWTLVSGTGTPINPTSPTSAVTGLTVGVNIFQWTITNGTCPSSSDQVKITVDPFPSTANAGADQTICISNVNVTMAANSPTIGSGAWALVTGQGTITNTTLENTTVTNLGGGANIFTWTITNGTCTPSVDTVIIFVDSLPSNSNAGTDQTICNSSSAFVGNAPTIGTGMWTLFSGTGTPTNPISPTSAVTGLSVGANIFVWAIVNGTCAASTDTVIINVDALPTTANAGADQFLCISTNNTLMTANNPSTGTGIWAIVSGSGNFANTTSPTSAINNVAFGTNIFTWTISNGTCPPSVDTMLIIVDSVPTAANAGANQTLCENNPTTSLNANTPTLGVGLWTLISGSGIITNPTSATTTVTNLATGTNVFQWAISLGNCSASVSTVTILVENLPTTADAGPDQNINTPMTQLSANIPVFGIGSWQLVSGTATIVNSNLDNTLITDLEVGTVTLRWTVSNGTCPASTDDVIINVGEFFIPNGFSPNGDGINDFFMIPGFGFWENIEIQILNRWGNVVYENTNYQNNWDGKNSSNQDLADDTYFYIVKIKNYETLKGFVVIKRN